MSPVLDPKPHHIIPLSVKECQKLALDYGEKPDRIVDSDTIKDEFSGLAIKMPLLISESDDWSIKSMALSVR
ncbi:hypothetical protein [Agarivorans gilvus]|uniref:Uncharacterized protein n=1 Tax=Agarivorans gilvus TaxID=680279 RepID=A0ABQ1I6D1_9ALTE|nr:hypothetical protein [Agarivorans gilvus]GGB21173.1 hypothetical protein GCM10007414_38210 [Agarivorans gilvus]